MYLEGVEVTAEPVQVICDTLHWLPPYADPPPLPQPPSDWIGRTDFFINYCTDWMLYRSIQELNLFLKEDQRQPISVRMVEDAWETVKTWNADLATTSDDLYLD
jgi:hypothetical protein